MHPLPESQASGDTGLARRQSALLRLSTRIAAAHTEAEVCESLVQGLHDDALGYNLVGVFLLDPKTGDRVLQASVGWEGVQHCLRLQPGQGLTERPLLDARLHYHPRASLEARWIPTTHRGCEVDVPIRVGEDVVGVLLVESAREDAFGSDDFEILKAAAQQAGIAIGRARLLATERQRADEQKALLETMQDLSGELELNRLLQRVLERAVSLLRVTGGELAIAEEGTGDLVIVASHNIGSDSTGLRLAVGEGAMGRVAETREPLIIPNYREWEGRSGKYEDTTAQGVMVVPLLIGQRLVGTLASVHTEEDRTFGDDDLRLLNLFAPQAAVAIENARLYSEALRQREFFKTVVTESPVAIVTLDLEGRISPSTRPSSASSAIPPRTPWDRSWTCSSTRPRQGRRPRSTRKTRHPAGWPGESASGSAGTAPSWTWSSPAWPCRRRVRRWPSWPSTTT
jgi:GAF domain-containing protein